VIIYTVDMSSVETGVAARMQNQGVLKNFAEKTGGVFIPITNGIAMRDALKSIVEELRVQYTLSYEPANLKPDGKWHALELRVKRSDLSIRTRRGFNAPKARRDR
jgi:VWFA-related protein